MTESVSAPGADGARWEKPPLEDYRIGTAVHVWRVSLGPAAGQLRVGGDILDNEEHVRAARFRRPADRERYVAAHSALRIILGRYLNVLPEQIRYVAGAQGKPGLAPGSDSSRLRFNLAHSGDLALVAVAAGREVGVDVEHFRPLLEAEPIAERNFSPAEREALAKLPEPERVGAFFNIWSCKEAFIKATGQGLSYPLQSFNVPLLRAAGQRPARVETGSTQEWGLRMLAVGKDYAGAVVAEGLDWDLKLWQY